MKDLQTRIQRSIAADQFPHTNNIYVESSFTHPFCSTSYLACSSAVVYMRSDYSKLSKLKHLMKRSQRLKNVVRDPLGWPNQQLQLSYCRRRL